MVALEGFIMSRMSIIGALMLSGCAGKQLDGILEDIQATGSQRLVPAVAQECGNADYGKAYTESLVVPEGAYVVDGEQVTSLDVTIFSFGNGDHAATMGKIGTPHHRAEFRAYGADGEELIGVVDCGPDYKIGETDTCCQEEVRMSGIPASMKLWSPDTYRHVNEQYADLQHVVRTHTSN